MDAASSGLIFLLRSETNASLLFCLFNLDEVHVREDRMPGK